MVGLIQNAVFGMWPLGKSPSLPYGHSLASLHLNLALLHILCHSMRSAIKVGVVIVSFVFLCLTELPQGPLHSKRRFLFAARHQVSSAHMPSLHFPSFSMRDGW